MTSEPVSELREGVRHVGELILCPYCLSQWVAGGFTVGLLAAPRVTRLAQGMRAAYGIADFVQIAYSAAENRA